MTNDPLLTLGALTLGGSVAVVIFALVSRASRSRYAARWRCWIWLLLCLRLIVPFSMLSLFETERKAPIRLEIPSDTIIYEHIPTPVPTIHSTPTPAADVTPRPTVSGGTEPVETVPGSTNGELAVPAEPKFTITLSEIMVAVWLAGIIVMAVWLVISHLRFLRYLRRWSRRVEDPNVIRLYNQVGDQLGLDRRPSLRYCSGLRAPMLAGVVQLVLMLPEEEFGEDLKYVFLHELTHHKRRDIWLKTLALMANVVHWFNPFMWYMVRLVERDTELACDEAALRQLSTEEHPAYGRTILSAVERLKERSVK